MPSRTIVFSAAIILFGTAFTACQNKPPQEPATQPLVRQSTTEKIYDVNDLILPSKWQSTGEASPDPATHRIERATLIAQIKEKLGPQNWQEGDIQILDGKLILRTSPENLAKIETILAHLRGTAAKTTPTPPPQPAADSPIKPGDRLRISIYDLAQPGQEYLKEVTVTSAGTIDLLYLGNVKIDTLTPQQAQQKIADTAIEKHAILPAGNGNPGSQVTVTRIP